MSKRGYRRGGSSGLSRKGGYGHLLAAARLLAKVATADGITVKCGAPRSGKTYRVRNPNGKL